MEGKETEYKVEYHILSRSPRGSGCGAEGATFSASIPDRRLAPYLGQVIEGGFVVDKAPIAYHTDFISWVLQAPLVKVGLEDAEREACPTPSATMVLGLGGMYGALARTMTEQPELMGDGMNWVSPEVYVRYWAGKGARVGVRQGDVVQWNDGSITPIPSFFLRYADHPIDDCL